MRTITITENNIKWIYGRLKKFFKHTEMVGWHQFDCGMKKHIGHYIRFSNNELYDTMRDYYIYRHELKNNSIIIGCSEYFDNYFDNDNGGFILNIGDKIAFLSNRIIFKIATDIGNKSALYFCLQIKTPDPNIIIDDFDLEEFLKEVEDPIESIYF